jgi:hypothetical protein
VLLTRRNSKHKQEDHERENDECAYCCGAGVETKATCRDSHDRCYARNTERVLDDRNRSDGSREHRAGVFPNGRRLMLVIIVGYRRYRGRDGRRRRVLTYCADERHTLRSGCSSKIGFGEARHGIDASRVGLLPVGIQDLDRNGGALEDKPRYNKSLCFDPFPFPDPDDALKNRIRKVAERLDAHRKAMLHEHRKVTMTGMYNVLSKLRSGEALDAKEREIQTAAACGILRDLHDELDRLVAEAYGWPWSEPPAKILDRLVELHDLRVAEERAGNVRWLRPEYQRPRFGGAAQAISTDEAAAATPTRPPPSPWPTDAIGQITALRALALAGPITIDEATDRFVNARRDIVARHLETLALLGEVTDLGGDKYVASASAV